VNIGFLYGTNEIIICFVFFAFMLVATGAGFYFGRKSEASTPDKTKSQISTIEAAILGVLGLLLGFTMSMAVSRGSQRHRHLPPSYSTPPRAGRIRDRESSSPVHQCPGAIRDSGQ